MAVKDLFVQFYSSQVVNSVKSLKVRRKAKNLFENINLPIFTALFAYFYLFIRESLHAKTPIAFNRRKIS